MLSCQGMFNKTHFADNFGISLQSVNCYSLLVQSQQPWSRVPFYHHHFIWQALWHSTKKVWNKHTHTREMESCANIKTMKNVVDWIQLQFAV